MDGLHSVALSETVAIRPKMHENRESKMSFGIDRKVNPIHILEFSLHYRNDPTVNNVEATVEEVFLVWSSIPRYKASPSGEKLRR